MLCVLFFIFSLWVKYENILKGATINKRNIQKSLKGRMKAKRTTWEKQPDIPPNSPENHIVPSQLSSSQKVSCVH